MERRVALEVLGLDEDVDLATIKQRFRTLARDRHPDRGGDPVAFQDLHTAYEVLRAAASTAASKRPQTVARGRPSRSDDPTASAQRLDADMLDEDVEAFAARVAESGSARSLSRAPGSWTNRFAASLAPGSTSTLEVTLAARRTIDAPHIAHAELTGRGRTARSALTSLDLTAVEGAAWSRRRGDAITVLEADLSGSDAVAAARRAAAATKRLLDALAWPLSDWRID